MRILFTAGTPKTQETSPSQSPIPNPYSPLAIRHSLFAFFLYALLTVGMTWPLVKHFNTHFAGQNIDVWINPWATWWTEKALFGGESLYDTRMMFYPHGVSLVFHSFSHFNSAVALLLRPLFGNLGAHNFTVLLAHALSGYAMFCLLRYLTRNTIAAFVAGLVFAFFPYRLATSVHPVLFSTQWMPLYLLYLLRLVDEGRRRHIAPAALFFLLTALASWHLMLFTGLITALYFAYLLLMERARCTRATWGNLGLMTLALGAITLPFVYPLIREQLTTPSSYVGVAVEQGYGNDLAAFLIPAEQNPVFRSLVIPINARLKSIRPAYLGATAAILGFIACRKRWRQARFWLLLTLLCMLLSLHPQLQIGGRQFDVTLPWSPPIVWLFRHPYRFNTLIDLGMAVLSGLGLAALLESLRTLRARWIAAGAATLLVLFEFLYLPFPLTPAIVPDYYRVIAADPGNAPVLELPMGRHNSEYYLYYQTFHNKPLIEGIVSRTPHEAYAFIIATPVLRAIRDCDQHGLPPADFGPVINALHAIGIESMVVHKELTRQPSLETWMSLRTLTPDYEDAAIAVYRPRAGAPTPGAPQLLEGCLAVRAVNGDDLTVRPGDTLDIPLEWIAGNTPPEDFIVELTLVDAAGQTVRQHAYEIVPGVSVKGWMMGKRQPASYAFPIDILIPSGDYTLRAALVPTGRNRPAPLTADLLRVVVTPETPTAAPTRSSQPAVNADYGNSLRLLAYDLTANEAAIHLALRWQAVQPITADYKFFVHLYAAQTGDLAAQADTVPQNWTFPTPWWTAGQVVTENVTLMFPETPDGPYRIGVGLYDAATGERLPLVITPDEFTGKDNILILPEVVGDRHGQ